MRRAVWTVAIWLLATSGALAGTRTITITGTVDEPQATVTVNGTSATVTAGAFSADVTLTEGSNTITASSTDPAGNTASTSVTVTLDTVPPVIQITFPTGGQIFGAQ